MRYVSLALLATLVVSTSGVAQTALDSIPIGYGATPPGAPDTMLWKRGSDNKLFVYNTNLSLWLGPDEGWSFTKQEDAFTGFLEYSNAGASFTATDTTTGAEVGHVPPVLLRVTEVEMYAAAFDSECTTQVWADQTLVLQIPWHPSKRVSHPTADSTFSWIAPAARVVIAADATVSADQVCGAGGVVDRPAIVIHAVEEVSP